MYPMIGSKAGRSSASIQQENILIDTVPALSAFTAMGTGGTKFVSEVPGQAIVIGDTSGGSTLAIHGVYRFHGLTPPFRIVLKVYVTGRQVNYYMPFIAFRESSSGKLAGLFPLTNSNAWEYQSWSNTTTRAAGTGATQSANAPPSAQCIYSPVYFGLRDDGTNVYHEVSMTGHKDDFFVVNQITKSGSYLTTYDQVAFGMFEQSVSGFNWRSTWRVYDTNGLNRGFS